ncbi:MAG: sulfite exporter TauE/SafE family protein, partial [Longispora sp.]|nr:sulfite exporter TauE/SafE family protein [Longispora sp. (in: high G+C Gram-positive bacteria)]
MNVPLLLVAGFAAGGVNAIAGGGSLITFPALLAAGLPPVTANVTNSVAVCPGYAASVVGTWPDLDRRLAVRLLPAAVLGALVGCALLLTTPGKTFEAIVPFLVLAASLSLLVPQRKSGHAHPAVLRGMTFVLSVYGGYFGAALGVMLLAGLAAVLPLALRRVVAVKNALSLIIGIVTVGVFALWGPVRWDAVAILVPATLLGGYLGARLSRR